MEQSFYKNLFNEYRMIVFDDTHSQDCEMTKAMTLNENLKAYGYTLKPQDIYLLASSPSINLFFENFVDLIPRVYAKPMYPNFPIEIMEMDEATFRFHQLLHYFSTYGIETLTGETVLRGWLPEREEIEKVKDDETLLQCKVIELVKASSLFKTVFKKIVTKKERLSIPEKQMLEVVVKNIDTDTLVQTDIPFKENLMPIAYEIVKSKVDAANILSKLCQHTGDVLKCLDYFLERSHFKITKQEKRIFVRALESYPVADFMNNVILSNRKANRTKVLLNYLNYNRYSKSDQHREVVRALRNNELSSWYGKEQTMINDWKRSLNLDEKEIVFFYGEDLSGLEAWKQAHDEKATLAFIGNRPGDMLRQINYLSKLGFSIDAIVDEMNKHVTSLSLETLITTYLHFKESDARTQEVKECFHKLIQGKMKCMNTPFKNKKVFLDTGDYAFEHSVIELNDKSQEGGYIRSGLAYRIPEDATLVRFFVYWNDKTRIDIDLHAYAKTADHYLHVGWNSDFKNTGIYFSGDITHSDAAEYIDIRMDEPKLQYVNTIIRSFTNVPFKNIETCFVGMQAVKEVAEEVKLYNPKNCFYYHELKSNIIEMQYAYIDVVNKVIRFIGKDTANNPSEKFESNLYSLEQYIYDYFASQNTTLVETREEADLVIKLDKAMEENEISILDSNYFLR